MDDRIIVKEGEIVNELVMKVSIFSAGNEQYFNQFNLSEQVRAWIIPEDYNHAEAEAKHLIYEADSDGDRELTKEEILDKYDVFVGSQATDFGEALVRHDEF